jgi:hypothetical protein
LIVDEADKAPLQVVCILKGLVEDGQMLLGDGRMLVSNASTLSSSNVVIPIHPSFRMIVISHLPNADAAILGLFTMRFQVLANRPGFPFLGNDFFKECGDVFSVHVVDNPDLDSEISLLRFYAPDVDTNIIRKLCLVFHDLRRAFDDGTIIYPYSARELVNIVKHLQAFPADGVVEAVQNVIAFDSFNDSTSATLIAVFSRHGIPIGVPRPTVQSVKLSPKVSLGTPKSLGTLSLLRTPSPSRRNFSSLSAVAVSSPSTPSWSSKIEPDWTKNQMSTYMNPVIRDIPNRVASARLSFFSELVSEFSASSDHGCIRRMIRTSEGTIHTLMDPPALHTYEAPDYSSFSRIDLSILSYFFAHQFRADKCFLFSLWNGDVGIVIQDAGVFVKLQPSTARLFYMKIPSIEFDGRLRSSQTSTIAKALYKFTAKPAVAASERIQLVLECGVMLYSCSSADSICCVDLVNDFSCSIDLHDIISGLLVNDLTNDKYTLSALAKLSANKVIVRCNSTTSTLSFCIDVTRSHAGAIPVISSVLVDLSFPMSCFALDHLSETSVFGASSGFNGASLDMSQLTQGGAHLIGYPLDNVHDVSGISCTNARMGCVISSFVPKPTFYKQPHSDDWLRVINVKSGDMSIIQSPRSLHSFNGKTDDRVFPNAPLVVIDLQSSSDGVVSLHSDGVIRIWQLDQDALAFELGQWQAIWGDISKKYDSLRLNKDASDRTKHASTPKHGKHDPKNERHSGGNTWAGGTGGSDTAGLGGKGGPYRLDTGGGHDIDQLSDEEKANVSDEVKHRAREMAKEALSKRLAEIGMGAKDASIYSQTYDRVRHEINLMRDVLNGVQTRQNEREWIRFQSAGDFDDGRIIDGAAGAFSLQLPAFC